MLCPRFWHQGMRNSRQGAIEGLCFLFELILSDCNLMEGSIPTDIGCLYTLEILNLSGNHMVTIPSGITQLRQLQFLHISHCKMLREIPEIPSSLEYIDAHDSTELLSTPSLLWSSVSSDISTQQVMIFINSFMFGFSKVFKKEKKTNISHI